MTCSTFQLCKWRTAWAFACLLTIQTCQEDGGLYRKRHSKFVFFARRHEKRVEKDMEKVSHWCFTVVVAQTGASLEPIVPIVRSVWYFLCSLQGRYEFRYSFTSHRFWRNTKIPGGYFVFCSLSLSSLQAPLVAVERGVLTAWHLLSLCAKQLVPNMNPMCSVQEKNNDARRLNWLYCLKSSLFAVRSQS